MALLRAISHDPRVLFADEPTGNLDPHAAERVEKMLLSWHEQARGQRTLVLVSHDLELAARLCDRIVAFRDGELLDEGGRPVDSLAPDARRGLLRVRKGPVRPFQ